MSSRTHSTSGTDGEKLALDGALAKQRSSKVPENPNVSSESAVPPRQTVQKKWQQTPSKMHKGGKPCQHQLGLQGCETRKHHVYVQKVWRAAQDALKRITARNKDYSV